MARVRSFDQEGNEFKQTMSRTEEFLKDALSIGVDIRRRTEEALLSRRKVHPSVVCIQRWVRGHITRIHLIRARQAAVKIQSYWRLYTTLLEHVVTVQKKFEEMCIQYYNRMAARIQAYWKGYLVRKYIANFSKRRDQLAACKKANEKMKETLKAIREEQLKERDKQLEEAAEAWSKYILHKLHHLVRTQSVAGVLSLKNSQELSEVETMLKSIKHKDFMSSLNKAKMEYIEKIYLEAAEKHQGFPKFMDMPAILTEKKEIEKPMEWPPCVQSSKNYIPQSVPLCGAKDIEERDPLLQNYPCCEGNFIQKPSKHEVRNRVGTLYSAMNAHAHLKKPIVLANFRSNPLPPSCYKSSTVSPVEDISEATDCPMNSDTDQDVSKDSQQMSHSKQSEIGSKGSKSKWTRVKESSSASSFEQKKSSSGHSNEDGKREPKSSFVQHTRSNKYSRSHHGKISSADHKSKSHDSPDHRNSKHGSIAEHKYSKRGSVSNSHQGDGSGDKEKIETQKLSYRTTDYRIAKNLGQTSAHASKQWVADKNNITCLCPVSMT